MMKIYTDLQHTW